MTREEAIEILMDTPIDIRSTREDDIHTLYATAQNMAIEALSADTDMSEYCDRLWKIAYERGKAEAEQHNKDAISREGLLKSWEELSPRGRTEFDQVIMTIPALQSADARPTGEWIMWENQRDEDVANGNYLYSCSNCGHADVHAKTQSVPYCWYCGARMNKGGDDE